MVVPQGAVRYSGHGGDQNFAQNFLLTKHGEVWKIVATAAGSLINDLIITFLLSSYVSDLLLFCLL